MTPSEVAEAYLNARWDGNLPILPEKMAVIDGLSVLSTDDLNRYDLAGAYDPSYNGNPAIFVNHRYTYTKRRFDCAIGLGHYILGHGQSIGGMNFDLNDIYNIKYINANAFATCLLMPDHVITVLIRDRKVNSVNELATILGVSNEIMTQRLRNLEWL